MAGADTLAEEGPREHRHEDRLQADDECGDADGETEIDGDEESAEVDRVQEDPDECGLRILAEMRDARRAKRDKKQCERGSGQRHPDTEQGQGSGVGESIARTDESRAPDDHEGSGGEARPGAHVVTLVSAVG